MTLLIRGGGSAGDHLAAALGAIRDRGARASPAPAAVVILVGTSRAPRPLADMRDDDWAAAFDAPLRQLRVELQAAGHLLPAGGRVILVASTGGIAGVAGDVAGCAVEEGARALAKSVALAWQPRGISLSFAAFAADALFGPTGIEAIVAPTVRMLLAAPPELTGSTIIADGAVLLAP